MLDHREQLGLGFTAGGHADLVVAGHSPRARRRRPPEDHAGEGRRAGVLQVPGRPVQACGHRGAAPTATEATPTTEPAATASAAPAAAAAGTRPAALDRADDRAAPVDDLDRQIVDRLLEPVADLGGACRAYCRRWFEQNWVVGQRHLGAVLAQRLDVVEHPEAAAMGRDGDRVVLDGDVGDLHVGQVQRQRLPGVAVVVGDVEAVLGAGVEQTLALRVRAYNDT